MIANVLARFGIGGAKVVTRLERARYHQGETVQGEIFVQGGQVRQRIEEIYLYVVVKYVQEGRIRSYVMRERRLVESFEVGLQESKVVPFDIRLPSDAPITVDGTVVYVKTGLDIGMAFDPRAVDGIDIEPHPMIDHVIQALSKIGFEQKGVECEYNQYFSRHPFVQKFHFTPSERYRDYIEQLSFIFYVDEEELQVIMEVKQRATDLFSSLEEALQLDQRLTRFSITEEITKDRKALEKELLKHLKAYIRS